MYPVGVADLIKYKRVFKLADFVFDVVISALLVAGFSVVVLIINEVLKAWRVPI